MRQRKPGEGLGPIGGPPEHMRKWVDRHTILEIRFREEDKHLNYIMCDCGWDGPPEKFPVHRREMIAARVLTDTNRLSNLSTPTNQKEAQQ